MDDSDPQRIAPLALELFTPAIDVLASGMRQKCRHWEEDYLDNYDWFKHDKYTP